MGIQPRRATLFLVAVIASLTGILQPSASGGDHEDLLSIYLPPGMDEGLLLHQLDDDLGSGLAGSFPEALLAAAVELDPERFGSSLEQAYRRYGFQFLKQRPNLPVGIVASRVAGLRVHNFNCLACHAGPCESRQRLVIGAPNRDLDFSGWYTDVMDTIGEVVRAERLKAPEGSRCLKPLKEARVRTHAIATVIAAARKAMQRRNQRLEPSDAVAIASFVNGMAQRPRAPPPGRGERYGPGRTIVLGAYRVLRFDLPRGPFAPVKPPDLFGVRWRKTLLWTGNELHPPERDAAERIARNGLLVPWIQLHPLTRKPLPDAVILSKLPRYRPMGKLLASVAPPPTAAPLNAREADLLQRGKALFEDRCSHCHGSYRLDPVAMAGGRGGLRATPVAYDEMLLDAETVGTDPAYTRINDQAFVEAFRGSRHGRSGLFDSRSSGAYVARPLLGLRLRAPYLHNASVPNLRLLLEPAEARPLVFEVGRRVPFDPLNVGLKVRQPRLEIWTRQGAVPGNRPSGHSFGSELAPADKAALLTYLQRL